jgi:hypothetical protein
MQHLARGQQSNIREAGAGGVLEAWKEVHQNKLLKKICLYEVLGCFGEASDVDLKCVGS